MNVGYVGEGKVSLLSGGGKCFTDIAARFVGSERSMEDIVASPYDKKLVNNILSSGHTAATEFDYFVFGVEGYSRVTEVQLVRKRLASYLIGSGRKEKNGKRSFDLVVPDVRDKDGTPLGIAFCGSYDVDSRDLYIPKLDKFVSEFLPEDHKMDSVTVSLDATEICCLIEDWYSNGVKCGFKEEDLRYFKPQATAWKGIIGMNAHALIDWFKIRMCMNAQTEIRDLAAKMYAECIKVAPDLFSTAGPSCKSLGYCPENRLQNSACKGKIMTHKEVLELIKVKHAK